KFKEVILPLAQKLGGEYAGSRPVLDSGWIEASRQVGQSGKVVTPDLYMGDVMGDLNKRRGHLEGMEIFFRSRNCISC
ncbi:MAG: hypothetical protein HGA23_06535, partial [Bacteroidales bacterium]|nr:hypothetical protein [Bacteroidales bacterium]